MKLGWGIGMLVAVLIPLGVWLLNLVTFYGMVSLILLMCGLWTIVAAFIIVEPRDRTYYSAWGVVIAILSVFNFIPSNYTIALILLAIVALIVINVFIGKAPKIYEAATNPTPAGGGTPAAS